MYKQLGNLYRQLAEVYIELGNKFDEIENLKIGLDTNNQILNTTKEQLRIADLQNELYKEEQKEFKDEFELIKRKNKELEGKLIDTYKAHSQIEKVFIDYHNKDYKDIDDLANLREKLEAIKGEFFNDSEEYQ